MTATEAWHCAGSRLFFMRAATSGAFHLILSMQYHLNAKGAKAAKFGCWAA